MSAESGSTLASAYFLSLSIENIRCFGPRQTLSLGVNRRHKPWTILLGENGSGKTTLLQALAAMQPVEMRSDDRIRVVPQIMWPENFESYQFWGNDIFARKNSEISEISASLSINDKKIQKSKVTFPTGERWRNSRSEFKEEALNLFCCGYGASRKIGSTSLVGDFSSAVDSLFDEFSDLINAEEWLLRADYSDKRMKQSENDSEGIRLVNKVEKTLIDLLPDVQEIRITEAKKFSKFQVEFCTPYGWIGLRQLSLGYRTLIGWVVDLAARLFDRYPNSNNPLGEPVVVLVDEIDLHLHPQWQRNVIAFLSERFPNAQFIATAHSPLVVQAAQNANIALLRREGDHVIIDNDVDEIRNWRIDQILTSDLFGLRTARSPSVEPLLIERRELLSKSTLTTEDRRKIQVLEEQIGVLPTGETPEDREAMDLIRRAASRLKGSRAI